jgi:hypothetical protein
MPFWVWLYQFASSSKPSSVSSVASLGHNLVYTTMRKIQTASAAATTYSSILCSTLTAPCADCAAQKPAAGNLDIEGTCDPKRLLVVPYEHKTIVHLQ